MEIKRIDENTAAMELKRKNKIYTCFVDLEDLPEIMKHTWHISSNGYVKDSQHKPIAEIVTGRARPVGWVYHHADGDKLNNRKSDFQLLPFSVNCLLGHYESKSGIFGIFKCGPYFRVRDENGKFVNFKNVYAAKLGRAEVLFHKGLDMRTACELAGWGKQSASLAPKLERFILE